MATTAIPVNKVTIAGLTPVTEVAADNVNGNHIAANDGSNVWLEVTNGGGASATVTLVTSATVGGRAVTDDVITIAAAGKRMIGPFPTDLFGAQPVIQCSASTVTVVAYMV